MCIVQSEQAIKLRNVLVSLEKNEWPPNLPESQYWIIMYGTRCWYDMRNTRQNRPTLPSYRLPSQRRVIKYAGYVAWILTCKCYKFRLNMCYNSKDIEFS